MNSSTAERLERVIATAPQRLADISEADAAVRPVEGGWSKKEILGHLVDSAGNNHQRFVRLQLAPSLEFPAYQQNEWVTVQSYATERWPDIVNLWLLFNRHLLHVIRQIPEEALSRPCSIGGQPAIPLGEVMRGYVDHLEHHLEQVLGAV
jgi:hypothetical protein